MPFQTALTRKLGIKSDDLNPLYLPDTILICRSSRGPRWNAVVFHYLTPPKTLEQSA